MKAALLSPGVVNRVRVTVVKSQTESFPLEKSKIPGVNKLVENWKLVQVRFNLIDM